MSDPVVIVGLGFTTQRLARRLRKLDIPVFAAVRDAERFAEFTAIGVRVAGFTDTSPKSAVLVHSIPPVAGADQSAIRAFIGKAAPRRILYISSTGVYGSQTEVSAATPSTPIDDKGRERVEEEEWMRSASRSSLILRSAAIYGPGRGVHVRLREGKLPRGAGGVVSRIHVDDLVTHLEAGIASQIDGAWPVADDCPAASGEIAGWCAELMGIAVPDATAPTFPVAGRSVNGAEIRKLLGVQLKYESYKTGVPASLAEEKAGSQ